MSPMPRPWSFRLMQMTVYTPRIHRALVPSHFTHSWGFNSVILYYTKSLKTSVINMQSKSSLSKARSLAAWLTGKVDSSESLQLPENFVLDKNSRLSERSKIRMGGGHSSYADEDAECSGANLIEVTGNQQVPEKVTRSYLMMLCACFGG